MVDFQDGCQKKYLIINKCLLKPSSQNFGQDLSVPSSLHFSLSPAVASNSLKLPMVMDWWKPAAGLVAGPSGGCPASRPRNEIALPCLRFVPLRHAASLLFLIAGPKPGMRPPSKGLEIQCLLHRERLRRQRVLHPARSVPRYGRLFATAAHPILGR